MAVDMKAPPEGDQEELESFSENTSYGTGLDSQQSPHALSASVAKPSQHISTFTTTSDPQDPRSIVYNINTLLKLRQAMDGKRVELRINPAALAENVFKDSANAHLTHERNMFSRGLSSFARRSTDSDEELTFQGRFMHQPLRQPRAPPRTPRAQQNEGFARFLKQYASPPHHRVTAGGKIVPAGPLSPPPMLTLGSIQGLLDEQSKVAEPFRKLDRTSLALKRAQIANADLRLGEFRPSQTGLTNTENSVSTIQTQGFSNNKYNVGNGVPQSLATGAYGLQPMGPMVQLPSGPVSTMMLQDGSTIYSMNGLMYRSYWNGTEMVLEPLNVPPTAPIFHDYSTPGVGSSQSWTGNQSTLNLPTLLGTVANEPQAYAPPVDHDLRVPALHNQFQNLQSRLTALDKHMALHLHEFPPTVHAALVAQRKELVEQLDSARVAKEQFERSGSTATPVFGPYAMAKIGDYQHSFGPQGTTPNFAIPAASVPISFITPRFAATHVAMESAIDQTGSAANDSWGAATNKGLSPDAPAFIPSFAQRTSSESGRKCVDEVNQHEHRNHASASGTKFRPLDGNKSVCASAPGKYGVKDACQEMVDQMNLEKSAAAHQSGTNLSPRSSSQDVLPLVSDQEAEYVDRLGLNPANGQRLYCGVPAEFQEVIRRAREQATLYGCLGGQSKDPAYDAEQDIRWAMSDSEPIMLPKKTVDHFAKPRPWNWNDSAYNYRVVHHTSDGLEKIASQNLMSVGSNKLEADCPSTPLTNSKHEHQTQQHADSWDSDSKTTGWLGLTSLDVAKGGPSESVERRGLENTTANHGPLSTKSGNAYSSQTGTKAFIPTIQNSASETKNSLGSFNELVVQVDTNENVNITRPNEQQPGTPHRRQYHAYVESYAGSPITPRNKFTALFGPAEAVNDNATYNEQMPSENGKPGDDPNSWSPVVEQKENWEPDQHSDNLSTDSWGIPSQSGKQEPGRAREKPVATTHTMNHPAPAGDYLTESRKTSRPTTSTSEQQATTIPGGIFNAPIKPTFIVPGVKNIKATYRNKKPVDSSSNFSARSKHEFLRGMLDSALNSSARANVSCVRHARYIPASEREPVYSTPDANGWEEDILTKQDLSAERQHSNSNDSGNKRSMATQVNSSNLIYSGQDARAIKAPYSLASSTYHAQGYMPQYDGAGNQLALKANGGFVPRYPGLNDHRVTPRALAQANPHYQYNASNSFNQSYRDPRNEQNPGRDSSAGHYGEGYWNSF